MPSSADSPHPSPLEIAQQLEAVERSLHQLQARYAQIQTQTALQDSLRDRIEELKAENQQHPSKTLKAEIQSLAHQIEAIEVSLESQYFPWQGLKEVFWQSVRFVGLGMVLGWVLKSWAG